MNVLAQITFERGMAQNQTTWFYNSALRSNVLSHMINHENLQICLKGAHRQQTHMTLAILFTDTL